MEEIEREMSRLYGFDIEKIYPYRDFFIVESSCGRKILRQSNLSPERILFVHSAKEHLYKNDFRNLDRFVCTTEGNPSSLLNGNIYTLYDAIEGRECDFDKKDDVARASTTLAMLHNASKGYIPPKECMIRDDLGKLPKYFSKRLEEMKRVKKIAQREKGRFDYLVLEYIDYFYNLGEDALKRLNNSGYSDIVKKSRRDGGFCHHDFTHCNIICDGSKTSVINFNYCSLELKIYDIANLIRRKMRKCDWKTNEAINIIEAYTSIEPISKEEFFLLLIILQFPQKFWRIINKYYNSRRTWREKNFFSKFEEVTYEISHHETFLKDLRKYIESVV